MNIAVDTNVLLRVMLGDNKRQAAIVEKELRRATSVSISASAFCELVWVMSQGYKISNSEIASAISNLIAAKNVVVNFPAIAAGLQMLNSGGDFADGVIAFDGYQLGAEEFISFDKKAVKLALVHGKSARLL